MSMRGFFLFVLPAVLALLPVLARGAEIANHPAVTPYDGSVATSRKDDGFGAYRLVTGVNPKGKTDAEVLPTLQVEGNLVKLAY